MRISEILSGKRAITVDTGLRLSRYFSLNDDFWTGLQLDHDAAQAKKSLAKVLSNIKPLEVLCVKNVAVAVANFSRLAP